MTAAARALNYAQPSVSHHLARLEAETGTKLVQRAGRGIRLTDAGRLLAERAAEVIAGQTAGLPVEHVYLWATIAGMPEDLAGRHRELVATALQPALAATP